MDPALYKRARDLFLQACDRSRDERTAFLHAACGDDPELRAAVDQMLASDADPIKLTGGAEVRDHIDGIFKQIDDGESTLPERIGEFRIIGRIGEGGMGSVLEAEQTHPRRVVALKMIRPDFGGPNLLKRFRREIDLLGQLDHPGIARIFQAGTLETPGGERPYFAMELVRGQTLMQFLEHNNLDLGERVALFAKICDAVNFAHIRGVIHRDLKPSNIMVTEGHRPVILDFGVARATNSDIQATTVTVNAGQIVGTLAYMSPEQASGESDKIDARSDVYSLGVVLFQVLTGRLPYNLEGKTLADAALTIRDQPPDKPSRILRELRGDLETIVFKAIEKDIDRRYESAAALSYDLNNYLADKPIVARPPSTIYELSKFTKRNKALVATVAFASLALLVATVFATLEAISATQARDQAEREADRAKAAVSFLSDVLASSDPDQALGEETTVRAVLDEAADRIREGSLDEHPSTRAQLHTTIGRAYMALGLYVKGRPHLESALKINREIYGESHDAVADGMDHLASSLMLMNEYNEAESLFRQAIQVREHLHGTKAGLGPAWPHSLASVLYYTGRYQDAEVEYRRAIKVCREHHPGALLANALSGLGSTLEAMAQYDEAIRSHQESGDIYRRELGDTSTHLANTLNNMANAMEAAGRLEDAEAAHRSALAIRLKILQPDHPDTAMSYGNLGLVLLRLGNAKEAEALCRKSIDISDHRLPPVHHTRAARLNNLAKAILAQDRADEACDTFDKAVEQAERALPDNHLMTLVLRANRANAWTSRGDYAEAESELLKCHAAIAEQVGPHHRRTEAVAEQIIQLYEKSGKPNLAGNWRQKLTVTE